jgi:hypothetical protein
VLLEKESSSIELRLEEVKPGINKIESEEEKDACLQIGLDAARRRVEVRNRLSMRETIDNRKAH